MDRIVKNILQKIEEEGYEAYIVGGYVRDNLLKQTSYDIDICTNALPKNLKNIFPLNQNSNNYGGFNLKIKRYNIDITTYRKEKKYDGHAPVEVEYVNNLFEDIKRRDFTINSLCMDKNGNIIDIIDARKDLDARLIKVIGSPDEKFIQDPLRMLRAIRFATILDFNIESSALESITRNSQLVAKLSKERIKEELSKILSSPNFNKGLTLLGQTKIASVIGLSMPNKIVYTSDILGMWAQIDVKMVNFTNNEQGTILALKKIIDKGEIDNYTLFNNGLYISSLAGSILHINKTNITKKYHGLPIKSMKDIDVNGQDIIELLNIEPSKIIGDIMLDIRNEILAMHLKNKKVEIKKYILGKWQDE